MQIGTTDNNHVRWTFPVQFPSSVISRETCFSAKAFSPFVPLFPFLLFRVCRCHIARNSLKRRASINHYPILGAFQRYIHVVLIFHSTDTTKRSCSGVFNPKSRVLVKEKRKEKKRNEGKLAHVHIW